MNQTHCISDNQYQQFEDADGRLPKRKKYLAIVFYLILVLFLFSKIFWGYHPMSDADNVNVLSVKVSTSKYISRGIFPLWNKNVLAGTPVYNNEVINNPLNLLALGMIPLATFMGYLNAYTVLLILCHFLMGFFTFRLCHSTLRLGFLPSLFAGAVYTTNMGSQERVDMMPGAFVVLPLIIESLFLLERKRIFRQAIITGSLLAIGYYSSSIVAVTWIMIPFIFLCFYLIFESKHDWGHRKIHLLFLLYTLISFVLLSSAALIPFLLSFTDYELVYITVIDRLISAGSILDIPSLIYFCMKYILQQIIPISELTGTEHVLYRLPLFHPLVSVFGIRTLFFFCHLYFYCYVIMDG